MPTSAHFDQATERRRPHTGVHGPAHRLARWLLLDGGLLATWGLALVAAVMAGVTATKTSRRWWPWAVGAVFTYGLPAIVLALLRPGNAAPAEDPAEVAQRPVPEPMPWFVGSGNVSGLMGVLLLVVDASQAAATSSPRRPSAAW
jgi:hypothetical protein